MIRLQYNFSVQARLCLPPHNPAEVLIGQESLAKTLSWRQSDQLRGSESSLPPHSTTLFL